jgi:hypothetical protein
VREKIRSWPAGCKEILAFHRDSLKLLPMKKETRMRILIILALVVGYIVVAVLRSGTAW